MSDALDAVTFVPAQKFVAKVDGLFSALGNDFVTAPVERLGLTYEGVKGDRHAGMLRDSGAREPWYQRGTEMRNERQLSILCRDELAEVAELMQIDRIAPEWIGANITLSGVPRLSLLPPRTLLLFESGVTIRIDGDNGPCSLSGASIAQHYPDRNDVKLGFPKHAKHRRGLVGWVEREGEIGVGDECMVRIWEQWIYPGVSS